MSRVTVNEQYLQDTADAIRQMLFVRKQEVPILTNQVSLLVLLLIYLVVEMKIIQ